MFVDPDIIKEKFLEILQKNGIFLCSANNDHANKLTDIIEEIENQMIEFDFDAQTGNRGLEDDIAKKQVIFRRFGF